MGEEALFEVEPHALDRVQLGRVGRQRHQRDVVGNAQRAGHWDTAAGIDPAAGAARDLLFSHPLATQDGLTQLWTSAGLTDVESAR